MHAPAARFSCERQLISTQSDVWKGKSMNNAILTRKEAESQFRDLLTTNESPEN